MSDQPDGIETSPIFEGYQCAQWKVGNADTIYLAVMGISERGGNRIVQQERPFRDGAKLDDTGAKARQWCFTAHFSNRINEPGTEQNGEPLYPGILNAMIRSFDEHETGDLTLPTVGKVRVRAEDYSRREDPEAIDVGVLELTFTQDNEDALDRALLQPPSVVATITLLAEVITGSTKRDAVWGEDQKSLIEYASEIQTLLLSPGRATNDLQSVVTAHRRALQSVLAAGETAALDADLINEPRGNETERNLRTMLDREAAAQDERTSSRPRTQAFVVDVERTSIYEIAARLDQDAEELLDLNAARIDDPFFLDRGMVIRVYESAAR